MRLPVEFFQEAFENSCPLWRARGKTRKKKWQPLQSLEKLKLISAQKPIPCWDSNRQKFLKSVCIFLDRILWIVFMPSATATSVYLPIFNVFSGKDGCKGHKKDKKGDKKEEPKKEEAPK